MRALGEALWSQTPWELTRGERGGELMFHYVRQRIRRRTTGFRRPPYLNQESITLHMRSGWNDNAYWQIGSCLCPSFSPATSRSVRLSQRYHSAWAHYPFESLGYIQGNNFGLWLGLMELCQSGFEILAIVWLYSSATAGAFYVSILLLCPSEQRTTEY